MLVQHTKHSNGYESSVLCITTHSSTVISMFTTDFIETGSHAKMFIDLVYYEALFLLSPYKMYVSDRGILLHRYEWQAGLPVSIPGYSVDVLLTPWRLLCTGVQAISKGTQFLCTALIGNGYTFLSAFSRLVHLSLC